MPLALLALAVGAFGIGTTEFVMMGLLPDVAGDLGVSIPTAGHLVSAYALGVVVGAPLLAAVTARMERRRVLLGLMALFVLGNGLSTLAPSNSWLLAARFLSGLPHGAFFGVGAVVATSLVEPARRARSMAMMFLGLTVANIVGVPVGTLLGQQLGWRSTFGAVCVIGVAAIVALAALVPGDQERERTRGRGHAPASSASAEGSVTGLRGEGAGLRGELQAFRSLPLWLALATTIVGAGGLFSAFSYITPMLTDRAGYAESTVTVVLSLFGVGATAGNLVGARLADRSLRGSLFGGLTFQIVVLLFFPLMMRTEVGGAAAVLLLGFSAFLLTAPMQITVMTKASDAPSLASSANQAAFNIANAAGAWVGGLALAAGLDTVSPAPVGAAMSALGIGVAAVSMTVDRRRGATPSAARVVASHVPAGDAVEDTAGGTAGGTAGDASPEQTCDCR